MFGISDSGRDRRFAGASRVVRGAGLRLSRLAAMAAFLRLALGASPATAHLSIIRQGHEAAGAFEADDRTGAALAAGDFNGDGRDDLAMGAPYEDLAGGFGDAGAVIVSYGSSTGITHIGSTALTAANSGGVNQSGAWFGFALLAADWNNDGFDDLAIGCPRDNLGLGVTGAGMVYLMQGSASGLQPWIQLDQADASATPEVEDRFGSALAAGDFNGDGRLDLAVGSPGEDAYRGGVAYFLNSAVGLPFGGAGTFTPPSLGVPGAAGDRFGAALAAGNFVGSSHADLAVGVPYFDDAEPNAGGVWIVRGSASGLAPAQRVFLTGWDLAGEVGAGYSLGYSLAAGRFFGGAYDALAIGEPYATVAFRSGAGRVFVCRGGASGLDLASRVALNGTQAGQSPDQNQNFGFALAAGMFEEPSPGFDDLAVGVPGRFGRTGQVQIFTGSANGPGIAGWRSYDQSRHGEIWWGGAEFGSAIVFGRFDGSSWGALAGGAPGMETYAGQVHIFAPWRQALDLSCRHSVAYDCEGNLVFSQKPFDQVMIASTTKTMTVLIAAERSQLPPSHPRHVSLQAEYVVPSWVAEQIPGSQVPLVTGEKMTLIDLMYTCMLRSGNDAANAIADLLWGGGGPLVSLPLFVQEMNDRAAQLGMTGTHFHNPAGLDSEPIGFELGEHYSTPVDMARLSRAAVENPIVAQIVAATSYPMTRHYGLPGGSFVDVPWVCDNIFAGVLANNIQPATGIKGGRTPGAQITGLFSALAPNGGTALAGSYLLSTNQGSEYVPDAARLLQVGLAQCNAPLVFDLQSSPFLRNFPGLPTREGETAGGTSEFPVDLQRGAVFSLLRQSGERSVRAGLDVGRVSEVQLAGDGSVRCGIEPFQAHRGFRVANMGTQAVSLSLRASYPAGGIVVDLEPGQSHWVTAEASPTQLAEYSLTITNATPGITAHLSVEETYSFETEIAGFGSMGGFEAYLWREGEIVNDGFWFQATGGDSQGDGQLYLAVHERGLTVDAPEARPEIAAGEALRNAAAAPNPFRERTRIGFELGAPGEVSLEIYDAQGRQVRQAPARTLPAGRWSVEWDGRDAEGRSLPNGIYFYKFQHDGRPAASGKVIRFD